MRFPFACSGTGGEPIRIAIVTEYLAKEGAPLYGGVDSRVVNICNEIAKRDDVHVVTSLQEGEPGTEQYGDIIVHRVGKPRPFAQRGQFLSRMRFRSDCAAEVAKIGPDIIEASGFVSYPAGLSCRERTSRPTVVTVHEVWQGEWSQNMGLLNGAIGNIMERRLLLKPFDGYIAVSNYTKGKLTGQLGIDPEKVSVIRNGVDIGLYDDVQVDDKFSAPTIVTVCRLVSYKRVDLLIRAVDQLKHRYPDVKLLIVGKGPEEGNLRALVQQLGLSKNVEFLGKYSDRRDLVAVLKRSHVFALPSIVEGFGIVVVEAMAAGVPYVASDIPPIKEVTGDGVGGRLFDPSNLPELVDQLAETLDHVEESGSDPRVKTLLEEYDWKNLSLRYEQEMEHLVNRWDGGGV